MYYKENYRESLPFLATIVEKFDDEIIVKSLVTNKEYELYYDQVLEYSDNFKQLIDISKYGA